MKCKTCGETDRRKMDRCAFETPGMGPRCEWVPDQDEKERIADAVNEIWAILRALDGPNIAARALAGVHVMLLEQSGEQTEAHVRASLRDSDKVVLDTWSLRSGVRLAS